MEINDNDIDNVEMFVEIPKGSSNKYEYSEKKNKWILDRVLSVSMIYPLEYGYIPNTLGNDGDELDVICYVNEKTFPGCNIPIRVIGAIEMIDDGEKDDKIIAVNKADNTLNIYKEIDDLGENLINKIKMFFRRYKDLENKKVEVGKILNKKEALSIIKKAYLSNK